MNKTAKTDNFLKAIKKYADQQRNAMRTEVEQLKEEKIKETEIKAKYDSEKLIKDKLEAKRNEETSKIAKLTQEGQKKLFLKRAEMTDSVFRKAEEKLIEYTKTAEYSEKLLESAKNIAALFGNESCTLYVNDKDMNFADKLKSLFDCETDVCIDKTIKIGGLKGYCKSLSIVADETLDCKLGAQREWFIENSGLSVL